MKIAVWKTGHDIADTVAEAVYEGLKEHAECRRFDTRTDLGKPFEEDVHIAYGILRGTSDVFKLARSMDKPWIHIDRGYWKPGHYDGYYRVSLNGTQQTFGLDKLEPDYERWDALGIEILDVRKFDEDVYRPVLYCPPTHDVSMFFKHWMMIDPNSCGHKLIVRRKGMNIPLQSDFDECSMVYTFNSSVGWEALRQGIPVVSDPDHSIVGAYQKLVDKPLHEDLDSRRRLFGIQASLQQTLDEIRSGMLWPLLQKLLSISTLAGTQEKRLPRTSAPAV